MLPVFTRPRGLINAILERISLSSTVKEANTLGNDPVQEMPTLPFDFIDESFPFAPLTA